MFFIAPRCFFQVEDGIIDPSAFAMRYLAKWAVFLRTDEETFVAECSRAFSTDHVAAAIDAAKSYRSLLPGNVPLFFLRVHVFQQLQDIDRKLILLDSQLHKDTTMSTVEKCEKIIEMVLSELSK